MKDSPTKERIICAALGLFRERGYEAVTIQDICDACGIGKNTFYYHFKSKQELLRGFHKTPDAMPTDCISDMLGADSCIEQMWLSCKPFVDHLTQMGVIIARQIMVTKLNSQMPGFHHNGEHPFHKLQLDILRRGQESGEFRNSQRPEDLVALINYVIVGAMLHWTMHDEGMDMEATVKRGLHTLLDVARDEPAQ